MNIQPAQPLKGRDQAPAPDDDEDIVRYIADMALELRYMAARANRKFLVYLLEMVFYEAFSLANRVEPSAEDLRALQRAKLSG
jgi:hypothetical protein